MTTPNYTFDRGLPQLALNWLEQHEELYGEIDQPEPFFATHTRPADHNISVREVFEYLGNQRMKLREIEHRKPFIGHLLTWRQRRDLQKLQNSIFDTSNTTTTTPSEKGISGTCVVVCIGVDPPKSCADLSDPETYKQYKSSCWCVRNDSK